MTPKQKAKELYNEFEQMFIDANSDSWTKEARDCAIFCVCQIIEVCEEYDNILEGELSHVNFWRDVKDYLEDQHLAL